MRLFNSFNSVVFLKEDSDLEKQLVELKNMKDNLKNTDEIDRDIKLLEYGIIGENEIAFELKNSNIGMYVLHDVTYECEGNKAQIDYLIFTRGNFYLIECKNLIGNITVDNNGQFYREYDYKGKRIKESIYSPYTQAKRHQDMLKKVWSVNHSKLENFIFGRFHGENFFKPLVVLANSKCFLNTLNAPKEIKDNIIRADQLISYIKKDISNMHLDELSSKKVVKKSCEIWLSRATNNSFSLSNKYLNQFKEEKDLEKKLKLFRIKKSKKINVPPYYIFTNEEMIDIIKNRPKNIDELKTILPSVKVDYHGKDILEVIDNNKNVL